jgi:hypothetical protein
VKNFSAKGWKLKSINSTIRVDIEEKNLITPGLANNQPHFFYLERIPGNLLHPHYSNDHIARLSNETVKLPVFSAVMVNPKRPRG